MSLQKTAITITTDDLLTVADAAKALEKHIATIYRWVDAGKIVGIKLGGILFIPKSEVERLNREKKNQATEGPVA
jgi:excisionase family DNA binding protein